MTFAQIHLLNFWRKNCEGSRFCPAKINDVFFVSTGLKQHHHPLHVILRFSKGPDWIRKAFLVVSQLDLLLYFAFAFTKFRMVLLRKLSLWTGLLEKISNLNKLLTIINLSWMEFHNRASLAFIIQEKLIPHAYGLSSVSLYEKILTQVFNFFKHLSSKLYQ